MKLKVVSTYLPLPFRADHRGKAYFIPADDVPEELGTMLVKSLPQHFAVDDAVQPEAKPKRKKNDGDASQ